MIDMFIEDRDADHRTRRRIILSKLFSDRTVWSDARECYIGTESDDQVPGACVNNFV